MITTTARSMIANGLRFEDVGCTFPEPDAYGTRYAVRRLMQCESCAAVVIAEHTAHHATWHHVQSSEHAKIKSELIEAIEQMRLDDLVRFRDSLREA